MATVTQSDDDQDFATNTARRMLWNHFILARALGRTARLAASRAVDGAIPFGYVDTHAGSGCIDIPASFIDGLQQHRQSFTADDYFEALEPAFPDGTHPGSWVLAGRVIEAAGGQRLVVEMDVNDIDPVQVASARSNREGTWTRFWSHDWFLFLRTRLSLTGLPDFIFIDPPPGDARGPSYAIDAAILLEALKVPFMISYSIDASQEPIDQIGRTGLELTTAEGGAGIVLGGGAESALLDILPDLRRLAHLLGGSFRPRLPRGDDYSI
ncbi:hypothetical protein [Telmatospirillum sp.]|uniref:hypothetical protein n=1 Tax=Telmatospirillum sp. TaxID=2079197 RepID=UPI0028483B0F|nr:hypothetical protein [Telmatospirillum sp.]MDR3436870.1 hypothetical protein [Telmatospirillum sp.]